jgi:hypothetical protein
LAVGARQVANAISVAASRHNVVPEITRTGSRALCWFEPIIAMEFCAESCGKCTPCRVGSTQGTEVIDDSIEIRAAITVEDLCDTLKLGSLCAVHSLSGDECIDPFPR